MHALYLLSVWLHIMAAVVWLGGTIFMVIALIPAIRRPEFSAVALRLIRWTAIRFRWVSWLCFGIFLMTGTANLFLRGLTWSDFQSLEFWRSSFGTTLAIKLAFVALIFAMSAFHDFHIGPRATAAWEADRTAAEIARLRREAVRLGRLNLILALAVTILGVMLVRGGIW
ncbi:MAG: DUF4149 domain-containing protein [Deltaproteobacteria bacterium]|nr:DUF4149 domain-containing protein [Deltaproteobacteria bacterium]